MPGVLQCQPVAVRLTQDSSSGRGAISLHIMLYIGWGKDGYVDGSYMRSFECKKSFTASDLCSFLAYIMYTNLVFEIFFAELLNL